MSGQDVIGVLQVGFSGFAFLLSGYSFRLLRLEVGRAGEPRRPLLTAIRRYANYTLIMALVVAASRLAESALTSWNSRQASEMLRLSRDADTCRDSLTMLAMFDKRIQRDYASLSELAHNTAPSCATILKALGDNH
jgi:hypothetical protein